MLTPRSPSADDVQRNALYGSGPCAQVKAMPIRHVILDRDGVLNEAAPYGGYITDLADWNWIPGALDGLALLCTAGIRTSIATNQSAVGRGMMSEDRLADIHSKMIAEASRNGAGIDAVMVCPHVPDDHCACRKPRPGLVQQALIQSDIRTSETVMIGDDETDLEASWAAGVTAVLVRTGKGRITEHGIRSLGVPVFDDLASASRAIVEDEIRTSDVRQLTVKRAFLQHLRVARSAAAAMPGQLIEAVDLAYRCLAAGHKIMACGNGGSASDAQHFVAELVGRYCEERSARAAIALTTDGSTLTALANDYGYERVFARQVEALGRAGDILVAISTSGRSRNVIEAARAARARGCSVIGFTGETGGELAELCDIVLSAPSTVVARIQEMHGLYIHALVEALDRCQPSIP
jgi:phosphoheptose isomerase